jgi:hypothetical protein
MNYLIEHAHLPRSLELAESKIPHAGLGIFTKRKIKPNTLLGIYGGETSVQVKYPDSKYRWALYSTNSNGYKNSDRTVGYVDGYKPERSNWCRYVNGASSLETENVTAIQRFNTIEYRSIQTIKAGDELLVYYGPGYNQTFKIK